MYEIKKILRKTATKFLFDKKLCQWIEMCNFENIFLNVYYEVVNKKIIAMNSLSRYRQMSCYISLFFIYSNQTNNFLVRKTIIPLLWQLKNETLIWDLR